MQGILRIIIEHLLNKKGRFIAPSAVGKGFSKFVISNDRFPNAAERGITGPARVGSIQNRIVATSLRGIDNASPLYNTVKFLA